MPKTRTQYVCQQCGRTNPRQMGRCPGCGAWNSMVEETVAVAAPAAAAHAGRGLGSRSQPRRLDEISGDSEERLPLSIGEFSRVLGGGIVPGSIVLIGGDPGIGKCVTADTRVFDPSTGDFLSIREWEHGQRAVLAVDEDTLYLRPAPVSGFFNQGVKPIIQVQTRLGRTLRCTLNHPLLTPEGWMSAHLLKPGSRIAAPRSLPYFGNHSLPAEKIKLIAYILSDGSAQSSIDVTNCLPQVGSDLEEIAAAFNVNLVVYTRPNNRALQYRFVVPLGKRSIARRELSRILRSVQAQRQISWAEWARRSGVSYAILNTWRRGRAAPCSEDLKRLAQAVGLNEEELGASVRSQAEDTTPVARYLEEIGLRYVTAADKAVPAVIFRLPRNDLALFLKTIFTCDGSVFTSKYGQASVSYSTISHRLAQDIQHLLLRFGLQAKLRTKSLLVNHKPYTAYEVTLHGVQQVHYFLREIGIFGREEACRNIMAMDAPRLPSTQRDTIPTGDAFWRTLQAVDPHTKLKGICRRAGVTYHIERPDGPITRYCAEKLAATYPAPRLQALAYGDVYWDTVDALTQVGEAEVYDLSIPEKHNFVANDLVIHNSTLLLQLTLEMARQFTVLYVSGEESERQIKMRALRLLRRAGDGGENGANEPDIPDKLLLVTETNLTTILEHIAEVKPELVVVDSVQTTYLPELESSAGSVSQVRETASRLRELAKSSGITVFMIGHVTKEGAIAGPRVLEHIVDTVLYLEGDRFQSYRLLRSVKNRFGATSEVGVFEMRERGMVEVPNPSEAFLAERMVNAPGSAIAVTMEGTRPLLVEIQGLTSPTAMGNPRRTPNGLDFNRLLLTVAVLTRRVGLRLGEQDIFANVVGGMTVDEPAADLAVAVAIASSMRNAAVRADTVLIGELGLSGELRMVGQMPARLREAANLGFKSAIVPRRLQRGEPWPTNIQVIEVRSLRQALEAALLPEDK